MIICVPGSALGQGSGNCINLIAEVPSEVAVSRFVCGRCGFSEEWIDAAEDIDQLWTTFGPRASA